MQKLIILLSSFLIAACAATSTKPDNINSKLNTNFNTLKSQYIYCKDESCIQPTVLEPYTIEDFKPIEPEPIPMINVLNESLTAQVNHNMRKKYKPKHYKQIKNKKINSKLVKKCLVVNQSESRNIIMSGNRALPIIASQDTQIINALESSVNKKTSIKNTPVY